jgi:hypothetical protein
MTNLSTTIALTPEQLKTLIRDAVREAIGELFDEDRSPEPRFAPEIAERLRRYRRERPRTLSVELVEEDLGLHTH